MNEQNVLSVLQERCPNANEREAQLFEFLLIVMPYVPPNLMNLRLGQSTVDLIREWITETYGLTLNYTYAPQRKKSAS